LIPTVMFSVQDVAKKIYDILYIFIEQLSPM
jgi:hypothetical protein